MKVRVLIVFALVCGLGIGQMPKAQAQVVESLARQVLPIVVPLAVTAVPIVIIGTMRAAPMVSAYLKERLPMPHFRLGRKNSNSAEGTTTAEDGSAVSYKTSVTGNIADEDKAAGETEEAAKEVTEAKEAKEVTEISQIEDGERAEMAAPLPAPERQPAVSKDPSRWMDDE